MKNLENKVAIVTGGNSGIGYAAAAELVAKGAKVIITGRNKEALAKAETELNVTGIVSDQSDLKSIDSLVEQVKAQFGKVDILFLNAGIASFVGSNKMNKTNMVFFMLRFLELEIFIFLLILFFQLTILNLSFSMNIYNLYRSLE
ncbi:SDR family NAD(P)-dependent oxidoreductase, partial [Flavobacterium sp. LBUM151]